MSTGIQWTDETWNPTVGCNQISAGCDHCYAKTLHDMRHKAYRDGKKVAPQYAEPFETVQLMDDRLDTPLSWRRPRRVFVNSVSDLFHEDVPDDFLALVFGTMACARRHTFQVLTKRAGRMRALLSSPEFADMVEDFTGMFAVEHSDPLDRRTDDLRATATGELPLPNVWLGVSVENRAALGRINVLRETPAAVRFISFEPLLSALTPDLTGISWAIIGGESGKGARPFHLSWARDLVALCREAGTTPFVKQLGANPFCENDDSRRWPSETMPLAERYEPHHQGELAPLDLVDSHGGDMDEWPVDLRVREFPKVTP